MYWQVLGIFGANFHNHEENCDVILATNRSIPILCAQKLPELSMLPWKLYPTLVDCSCMSALPSVQIIFGGENYFNGPGLQFNLSIVPLLLPKLRVSIIKLTKTVPSYYKKISTDKKGYFCLIKQYKHSHYASSVRIFHIHVMHYNELKCTIYLGCLWT